MTWHATCKGMLLAYTPTTRESRWHGTCKGMALAYVWAWHDSCKGTVLAYVCVRLELAWFLHGSQQPATHLAWLLQRACVRVTLITRHAGNWHGSCMGSKCIVAYGMDLACLCKSCSGTDLAVLGCVQLECM